MAAKSNSEASKSKSERIGNRKKKISNEKSYLECNGKAKEALETFRKRCAELKEGGQRKPDMVAFKELRTEYTPPRTHGHIEGIPVGMKLRGRGEAAILGIHQQMMKGIDSIKGEACYAICATGVYQYDNDDNADGSLLYTGHGGLDQQRRQVKDQSEESAGNAALILSQETQKPIRVLRGKPGEFYYEGLYLCESYEKVACKEGPLVLKFKLMPITDQSSKHRSIVVESKPPAKERARKKDEDKPDIEAADNDEKEKEKATAKDSADGSDSVKDPFVKKKRKRKEKTVPDDINDAQDMPVIATSKSKRKASGVTA